MRVQRLIAAIVLTFAAAAIASAGQKSVTKPGETIKATATIQQIDSTARIITFKNEDGSEDQVWAGPEFARFKELKVGDKVNLTYYSSTVYSLRKPGQPGPKPGEKLSAESSKKALPGGTIASQQTDTVTVKSVDATKGVITVTTSRGHTVTRKVDDKKNLEGVKAGDKIDITYTEAVLANVERPK